MTSWQQGCVVISSRYDLSHSPDIIRLPLDPVMLVISELMPKLQEFQASHKSNPTVAILDYLGHISLKHILPNPPPLNPRKFIVSTTASPFSVDI